MVVGAGGVAFHSLSLSALKISEGKENEFEKKRKGKGWRGCEKREKYRKKKRKETKRQFFEEFAGNTDLL